jgi:poly(3-hydroxybutyrate) depolymerase
LEETYSGCKEGTEVKLVTLKEEGHAWPGGLKWAPWADEPTHEFSATDRIWEFFEQHPKE